MLKRSLQNMMNLTEFVKTLTLVSLKHLNILNSSVILTKFSKSTSYFIYIYVIYVYACAYVQMCIYQSFSSSKLFLLQAIYLFRKKMLWTPENTCLFYNCLSQNKTLNRYRTGHISSKTIMDKWFVIIVLCSFIMLLQKLFSMILFPKSPKKMIRD